MTGYLSLGFELAAELTYPESEGLSSGLLNTSAQIFGLILIHVATTLRTHHGVLPGNLFLTALLVLGSIMTICIKENLLRQQAHERVSTCIHACMHLIEIFYAKQSFLYEVEFSTPVHTLTIFSLIKLGNQKKLRLTEY
ncbi:unnamed protein product [Trichobilharzia regenti]|nr:unnamed protein product [Trichobilharzia regenti]